MNLLNKLSGIQDRADERAIHPRVLVIVHNAKVPTEGNRRLNQVLGWNEPEPLIEGFIGDMKAISDGYVNYKIVDTILVPARLLAVL
jgi:hypothetical protein